MRIICWDVPGRAARAAVGYVKGGAIIPYGPAHVARQHLINEARRAAMRKIGASVACVVVGGGGAIGWGLLPPGPAGAADGGGDRRDGNAGARGWAPGDAGGVYGAPVVGREPVPVHVVPEPGSDWLLAAALGILGIVAAARRAVRS